MAALYRQYKTLTSNTNTTVTMFTRAKSEPSSDMQMYYSYVSCTRAAPNREMALRIRKCLFIVVIVDSFNKILKLKSCFDSLHVICYQET